MLMEGIGTAPVTTNGYKYNSKELNADLGLNWYDYGARWYDPAVGRWWGVDPMAEKAANYSVYTYALNNPALLIDPDGMLAGNPFEVMEERKQKAKERQEESDEQYSEGVTEKSRESGDIFEVQLDEPTSSPKEEDTPENTTPENTEDCCPDWMNNYLPIWSSGRDAYLDWQNGSYGWAIFNGAMAVSDVFLVKSVFVSGGKILLKGGLKTSGSHTWGATTQRWRKKGIEELTGGSKHHWAIRQNLMDKYPELLPFGNQFPNIIKYANHADHMRYGHGTRYGDLAKVGLAQRFWFGTPTWIKSTAAYGIDKIENNYFRKQ